MAKAPSPETCLPHHPKQQPRDHDSPGGCASSRANCGGRAATNYCFALRISSITFHLFRQFPYRVLVVPTPATMAPPNPTGFDMKTFKAAANPKSIWAQKDPWKRNEAWRYSGPFSRMNRLRNSFPGLGIATVAFAIYCGYEWAFLKDDHHGEGHH
uniref:NADH-ubiquinone oxidoreductase B12 subunit n=1 Tax=Coccidioides posadasii RMSCC 3488 TaxID=454284 RepID=A0A0J6FE24_COCPO|nr:hypothetical protein CPAG_03460 [Coccidioides posadasii RMSCC 3488]